MLKFVLFLFFSSYVYCNKPFNLATIPMCIKQNSSCSYLFGDAQQYTDDFCTKIYYEVNNQFICDSVYDETIERNTKIDLGRLILLPFYGDQRTIFNVTFVDIKFSILKIRFQQLNTLNKCMVKDFILKGNVPADKSFEYVCPWSTADFEGQDVDFHYEYGRKDFETRKKYRFTVPLQEYLNKNFKNIYFFAYVDYTDLYILRLKIVPAPERFNVTSYKIKVLYMLEGNSTEESTHILPAENGSDLLEYIYYPGTTDVDYYFEIEPHSNYCQNNNACVVQETPKIHIKKKPLLYIGIIGGVTLLIPTFMLIIYMWKKSWPGMLRRRANVLLVTVPINDAHVSVAPAFATFLKETYNLNVLLDIQDVPRTANRNSLDWLKVAIHHATHVVFLRSNDSFTSTGVIYQDTYLQTMHLLNPKFNSKKCCIVSFPYSGRTTELSHPELVHITDRFQFQRDRHFNRFIKFLIGKDLPLRMRENYSYQTLLTTLTFVENDPPVNINQQNPVVQVHVCEDNEIDDIDFYPENNVMKIDDEKIQINFDLDEFDFLGERNQKEEQNDDNSDDIDSEEEYNFLGNA